MKQKIGTIRWRIVALLFFATTINYIDRQVIGILKPYIAEDLGWSEFGYGNIVSAFQFAYAIGLLLTGRILDKIGTKLGYTLSIVIWSISGMAHALAKSVFSFGVARAFLGIGESANFPAAVKTVAEWFPKKERSLATGWFNSGSSIGAIVAPIIVSFITLAYGWKWAFIITGLLGFIWIIFWLVLYEIPKKHKKLSKAEFDFIHQDDVVKKKKSIPWIKLFTYKPTYAICLSRFVTDWVWWFFLFWIPDFLNKTQGIDLKEVVLPLIIIYTVAGIGGVYGGLISSNFIRNGRSIDYARKTSILICAILVVPIILTSYISNLWVVVGLIALATAAHQGWASNIFTVVSDIYPKNAVASMIGLSGFTGAIGGVISAFFVGLILQLTNSYFLIFSIAGTAYLLAWLILKILIPNIGPVVIDDKLSSDK
ncbi:MFS transporter [Bacteroidota bacterium]